MIITFDDPIYKTRHESCPKLFGQDFLLLASA